MDKDKRGDVVSTTSPLFEYCYDDEGLIMSVCACLPTLVYFRHVDF